MKYIDKLTEKQEKAMVGYAKKWIKIGLRTGKTDWKTFDKYFPICYEKANLEYPKNVVRVQSPLVGALAASVAQAILQERSRGGAVDGAVGGAVRGAVDDAVGGAVGDAVRGAVGDAVRDAVGDAVDGAVRGAVGGAVDDAVRGAVDGAVGDAVDDAVRGAVDDAVDGAVRTAINIAKIPSASLSWHYWLGGQFWVGYWYWYGVAAVNFLFDICKLKLSKDIMERALSYRKVCESVNYIWPNRDFVMVCARPVHIDRDERGRLHSTTRKAIQYPDGWGLYMYHGILVPEQWILHPEKLTKEDWGEEKNLEKRRIIQELMGVSFPKKIGAKLISKPSKEFKKHNLLGLYEVKLPNDPEEIARYVKVQDHSSKRQYYIRTSPKVPNDDKQFTLADESLAASFQMRAREYQPMQEA